MIHTTTMLAALCVGIALLAASLTFGVKYNQLQWESSYIGRTTMLSTFVLGLILSAGILAYALGWTLTSHSLILLAAMVLIAVTHRKHVALRQAREKVRGEVHEAALLDPTDKEEVQ